MKLWTYAEIEKKVRTDTDLQDAGNFIGDDEMAGYCNDAIDMAEAEILKISEDYFLTKADISLVSGTNLYDLPENIYAQKIREVIYINGTRIYPILRIRDPHKFYQKAELESFHTGETEYTYMLVNDGAQAEMQLVPAASEDGPVVQMWYIRNAARIPMVGEGGADRAAQLATVVDIPEWTAFLVLYMKAQCLDKDKDPRAERYMKLAENAKDRMVETLTNRTPDNQDEVPMDTGFYVEHN